MKCAAEERWKFLSTSLRNKKLANVPISTRHCQSFDLVLYQKEQDDAWWRCRLKGLDVDIIIRLPEQEVNISMLAGFNNTGHIRIWPSELVLAHYCLLNKHFFNSKRVCEVAGGQTCFAGLALAHCATPAHILLTDGSLTCVQNVEAIIQRNDFQCQLVSCSLLRWDLPASYKHLRNSFDCVLMADCLFFEEGHKHIVDMLLCILQSNGMAIVMAPLRKNNLKRFVEEATKRMWVSVHQKYDQHVWSRRQQLPLTSDNYDDTIHYPLLLTLSPKLTP